MIEIKRNGKTFFVLEDFSSDDKLYYQLMDHHYISLTFNTSEPIYFEVGDSVELSGFGVFMLVAPYYPQLNTSTGSYEYSLEMQADYRILANKICKYRPQLSANETSFDLTQSVGVHASVILDNIKALGLKHNSHEYTIDYSTYNKDVFDINKAFHISYSSLSILDAIAAICEELDCEYWVDGSVIYFGRCEFNTPITFEQDINVASISASDTQQDFTTRLYAYGSDRNIPKGYFTGKDADITKHGVAADNLMLPTKNTDENGFYAKNGYIENTNIVKNDLQAVEGVVVFDDEYPRLDCVITEIRSYVSTVNNDDGTKTSQRFYQITDKNSAFVKNFAKSWRKERLKLSVKFTSGSLNGMEFELELKIINETNFFEIVVNDSYGRTLPDESLYPKVGDKFFVFNWDATKITETNLIQEAQESLYERAKAYYMKSMIDPSNFTCIMDNEWAYNHGTTDILPIGQQIKLISPLFNDVDASGHHYRDSRIIGCEIKLDLPYDEMTYIVGEKSTAGRLSKLEEKVESISTTGNSFGLNSSTDGVYVIGEGDPTPETDSNVYSSRRTRNNYLSKTKTDVANELIRFLKGLLVGSASDGKKYGITAEGVATLTEVISNVFSAGALGTGFRLGNYGDTTDSYLEVDRLLVRKVAEFIELVIRELRHVGGEIVLTPAAMKCVRVEAMDESDSVTTGTPHHWRCYFTAEQDGKTISNDFVAGDLVRCQTFNVKKGVNANAKNKYYWRKVSGVGDDYIDVLFKEADTNSDVPAAGDEMVQLGSTVAGRQAAIMLASYGDDAPSIKCYRGINSYSTVGKEVFVVSKEMIDIIADRLRYRTDNGVVDVADKFASIELDANGLKTQVSQQGEDINKHTTQLDTLGNEIKGMDSKIEQTATQISLSVGLTLSERKNMLVGSAFRKQGEGCRYNGATITRTMGYDGTNALRCMGKGTIGARWLGGTDGYSNVRLEKGKTYTLSFLARAVSAGATVVAEVIWQGTAKDASRPAGYAGPGPEGSAAVISGSVANDGQWHVYQKTFTVPANAAYEWVEVFVFANNADADHTVYIARPMLAESIFTDVDKVDDSKYTGWSLSAEDYDYIGGNMLDNCRRLTIGGNLTAVGSIDDTTAYDLRCAAIHAKSTTTQMAVVAQWQVGSSIVGGKDYILQFMAKGKGMIKAYMYGGSNISIYAESSGESMEKDATADGYRFIELTDSWTPCWVHWRSVGSGTPQNVLLRVEDGAEAWVTMPKMEAGAKPTDWTDTNTDYSENASVASKLLRSGLDIENGKITATANSFEVRNNAGVQTASVNENGVFVTNEAVLRGSIYANNGYFAGQIKHKMITVTKDNFGKYFNKVDESIRSNAYAPIFKELGSNMYIESVPKEVFDEEEGVLYMWLPNIFPTTHPYTDNRYELARESVGNTISVRLAPSCDIGVLIYGVATADSDGSKVRESDATITAGQSAYLTCRVGRSCYLNSSSSLVTDVEIVYWEAIVGRTIDNANAHNLINL